MNLEIIFLYSMITILSLVLLLVTFFSYLKYKNSKLLFVSFVFLFLFIRGVLLSIGLFYVYVKSFTNSGYIWIFDLIILILLYAAYSIKR